MGKAETTAILGFSKLKTLTKEAWQMRAANETVTGALHPAVLRQATFLEDETGENLGNSCRSLKCFRGEFVEVLETVLLVS